MTPEIKQYLEQHERTIAPLYKDCGEKFWNLSLTGKDEDEQALVEAKERYLKVYNNREEFRKVREWHKSLNASTTPGVDPLDTRQIKLIYFSFVPHQLDEKVLRDIVERETRVENLFNTFRADFEGGKASDNQLRDVLKRETDISRRRAAWEATKQVGQQAARQLVELVEIRNREAKRLGFRDYYAMMLELQELEEKWLFNLLDDLDQLSEKAFVTMKEKLDQNLKRKYGISDRESYPWLYGDPFFQDNQSAGGTEVLDRIFKGQDVEALTRNYYSSIGLDIDDLLKRSDLYEREGKSQHAFCMDVDHEGDVRVLCNIRQNEQWMSTMLHEFGHAVYDKYNDRSLPFLLRTPAHTLTTEAIAMLNGRMTKNPSWLSRVAGVPEADAASVASESFEMLRAGMLIFLRWAITLVRFEKELYRDPSQPLNELWWDYVQRFQKVTPPPGRNTPDWASKIHLASSPVYYQNYILGELMASQVLDFMHRVVVSSETIVGRRAAGAYLVDKIFRPGARDDWSRLLKGATDEGLNAEHFVRQFVAA